MSPAPRPAGARVFADDRAHTSTGSPCPAIAPVRHAAWWGLGLWLTAVMACAPTTPHEVVVPAAPPLPEPAAELPPEPHAVLPREVMEAREPVERPDYESPAESEEIMDMYDPAAGGVMGGVPGGVMGGVPGGVMGGVAGGVVGGTPSPPAPPPYASAPRVKTTPACPFPKESDDDGVDQGRVILRVTVETTGKASKALVLSDPGHGFGRAARACALTYTFEPAKDVAGAAVKADVTLAIRFDR